MSVMAQMPPHIAPAIDSSTARCFHGILTDLRPADGVQPLALFTPEFEGRGVGKALDDITRKLGGQAVGVGLAGFKQPSSWEMKRAMLSKRATTHWDELVTVKA